MSRYADNDATFENRLQFNKTFWCVNFTKIQTQLTYACVKMENSWEYSFAARHSDIDSG